MNSILLFLLPLLGAAIAQNPHDSVRIIAFDYNRAGNRVVYVEQRGSNEDPQAKYLYIPSLHPVPAIQPIRPPVNIRPVPPMAPALPLLRPLPPPAPIVVNTPAHPSFLAVPGPNMVPHRAHVAHFGVAPAAPAPMAPAPMAPAPMGLQPNIVPLPAAQSMVNIRPAPAQVRPAIIQAPAPRPGVPVRQYIRVPSAPVVVRKSAVRPAGFLAAAAAQRQVVKRQAGTLMSPPVNCVVVTPVPPTAHSVHSPDTEVFACEILSPVLTGVFTVQNDNVPICHENFDEVTFDGRTSHTTTCE